MRLIRHAATALLMLIAGAVLAPPVEGKSVQAHPAYTFVNSVGLGAHLFWKDTAYFTEFDRVKAALIELGIHHVRTDFGHPDSASDMRHRNVRDLWTAAGIKSTLLVDLRNGDRSRLRPGEIPAVLAGIRSQIGREPIDAIEGANEFNLVWRQKGYADWASDLREYQARLYRLVKSDPALGAVPVLGPSLAPDELEIYTVLGDLSAISNASNGHVYTTRFDLDAYLNVTLPKIALNSPGAPVWISEYGWHTAFNSTKWHVSEAVKAKYLTRGMAELMRRRVNRGIIYQLLDHAYDPYAKDNGAYFGLLDYRLMKKLSYFAVRNMMHILCDTPLEAAPSSLDYALSGDLTNVHSVLLQKNSRAFYLLLWQEVQSYGHPVPGDLSIPTRPLRLTLNGPVWTVRTYLPTDLPHGGLRGREPLAVYSNPTFLDLKVPDHVMVLEIFPRGVPTTPVRRSCDFPAS